MVFSALGPGLHTTERVEPSGWSLGMFVVTLPSGGTLLHAPVWLDDAGADEIARIGPPEVLLAPNHYHHLSLTRYRARFPAASVVASDTAKARLTRLGHGISPLSSLSGRLPPGGRVLECEGTRNGEVFLSLPWEGGRAWIVCDALFNVVRETRGVVGFALRGLATTPGLCLGRTFVWLGLEDRARYRAWLEDALATERPSKLFFSHGAPYEVGTGEELRALLALRLS